MLPTDVQEKGMLSTEVQEKGMLFTKVQKKLMLSTEANKCHLQDSKGVVDKNTVYTR